MTRDELLDEICREMAKLRDCVLYFRTPHDEAIVDSTLRVLAAEVLDASTDYLGEMPEEVEHFSKEEIAVASAAMTRKDMSKALLAFCAKPACERCARGMERIARAGCEGTYYVHHEPLAKSKYDMWPLCGERRA